MPDIYQQVHNSSLTTKFHSRRGSLEDMSLPVLKKRGETPRKSQFGKKSSKEDEEPRKELKGVNSNNLVMNCSPSRKSNMADIAVINVIDDSGSETRAKRTIQVFKCTKSILLRHMTYFYEQLVENNPEALKKGSDVEISVHCEAKIFEWLIRYMYLAESMLSPSQAVFSNHEISGVVDTKSLHLERREELKRKLLNAKQEGVKDRRLSLLERIKQGIQYGKQAQIDVPPLSVKSALSLALSSAHLGIPDLRDICLEVMLENLSEVVKIPIQMSSLGDKVLGNLAAMVPAETLDHLDDEKDRLKSLLFQYKIDQLLSENPMTRCMACKRLYCKKNQKKLWCESNKSQVLADGKVQSRHQESLENPFDFQKFKKYLLDENFFTPRELYWKLWGFSTCFKCKDCDRYFPLTEYNLCKFHPQGLNFEGNNDLVFMAKHFGVFRCCLRRAFRFDPFLKSQGCQRRDHSPDLSDKAEREIWNQFIPHMTQIREYNSKQNSNSNKRKNRIHSSQGDSDEDEPIGEELDLNHRERLGSDCSSQNQDENLRGAVMSMAFGLLEFTGERKTYDSSKEILTKNLQKFRRNAKDIKSPRVKKIHHTLATVNRKVMKMQNYFAERQPISAALKKGLKKFKANTRNLNHLDIEYGMSESQQLLINNARDDQRRKDAQNMDNLINKLKEKRSVQSEG